MLIFILIMIAVAALVGYFVPSVRESILGGYYSIKDRFLEDCRHWWKLWSSWLAIVWGIIVTVFWNDPTLLGQLVDVLPGETRALLSPLVLGVVAALPIIIRLLKQQKLGGK